MGINNNTSGLNSIQEISPKMNTLYNITTSNTPPVIRSSELPHENESKLKALNE